jgi:hypothetical protein
MTAESGSAVFGDSRRAEQVAKPRNPDTRSKIHTTPLPPRSPLRAARRHLTAQIRSAADVAAHPVWFCDAGSPVGKTASSRIGQTGVRARAQGVGLSWETYSASVRIKLFVDQVTAGLRGLSRHFAALNSTVAASESRLRSREDALKRRKSLSYVGETAVADRGFGPVC